MPAIIKDKQIVDDSWQLLPAVVEPADVEVPETNVIVPLNVWQAQKDTLAQRQGSLGVWLDCDETAEELGSDAKDLALVAINFPGFMDGRGFSTARVLRDRFQYDGELRAVGAIIRDQLCYLQRCGFNSFAMAEDINLEQALNSLNDFTEFYQAASDQTLPLFRRRA